MLQSPVFRCQRDKGTPQRMLVLLMVVTILIGLCGLQLVSSSVLAHRLLAAQSYQISGTVFDDLNQDGELQPREPGVNGVTITASNANNQVVATAPSATVEGKAGHYTLAIPAGTGPVRVQFSGFGPAASATSLKPYHPTRHNTQKEGTTLTFVNESRTLNQGLQVPSDYCQNLPKLSTNCYVWGNQLTGENRDQPVLVSWPYDRSGNSPPSLPPDHLAMAHQIGTTWGTAYPSLF